MYPAYRMPWIGFGKGRMPTTHTHKGERGQRNPSAQERLREVSTTGMINKMRIDKINK